MKSLYPILFIFSIFLNTNAWSTIIYVNPSSPSTPDGTDWQHAFHDLQNALNVAQYGDSVWVAEYIYYPTTGSDRNVSFLVPNGVVLLGGFSGIENNIFERSWEDHLTILSGNIGNLSDSTDNSLHVLHLIGADSTTIIDGFTIQHGYAKPPMPGTGGNDNNGGGILVTGTSPDICYSPLIRNCKFEYNVGRNGGAIYCDANSSIKLIAAEFKFNYATLNGGAVYKVGGSEMYYSYYIVNCYFEKNKALDSGGAIYHENPIGTAFIDLSVFERDTCMSDGGAINWNASSGSAIFNIHNSIFEFNKAGNGGALSFTYFWGNNEYDSYLFQISSCNFKNNRASAGLGGGISIINTGNESELDLIESIFESNSSLNGGGAIYFNNYEDGISKILIQNCKFYQNLCTLINASGAFYYQASTSNTEANIRLLNTVFYGNRGAMGFITGPSSRLSSEILNCTFANNGDYVLVKNWDPTFDNINFYNKLNITNTILWEYTPLFKLFFNNNPDDNTVHDYYIDHSIINAPDCVVEGVNFCSQGVLFETWPMFQDTATGDLRIAICSPAVNAGNNTAIDTTDIVADIEGGLRKVGDIVDIGAYEQQYETIEAIAMIENTSNAEAMDGSIAIDSYIGGAAPYSVLWENGDTILTQENLSFGDYIITITDVDGCSFTDTLTVDFTNGLSYPAKDNLLIYPNPAKEFISLYGVLPGIKSCDFYLHDALGREVLKQNIIFQNNYGANNIPLGKNISSGVYFYNLVVEGEVIKSGKIVAEN
jgi:predicted outer membrane repeat protein